MWSEGPFTYLNLKDLIILNIVWSGIKLQCSECGYSVGTKQKFKEHMKKHEDVASLRCQECDYVGKQGYIIYIFLFFLQIFIQCASTNGKIL